MKKKYLLILLFITAKISSQTFSETAHWISRESQSMQQVIYNNKLKNVDIVRLYNYPNISRFVVVNNIDPKAIESISIKKDSDGNYNLRINFGSKGTIVSMEKFDDNNKLVGGITKTKMYGLEIYLGVDSDKIKRFKKAYLHLFNQVGANAKDGDIF